MTPDVIATVLTGVGVLLGVWRMADGVRRDLTMQISTQVATINARIDGVNTRIDNILLADRQPKTP